MLFAVNTSRDTTIDGGFESAPLDIALLFDSAQFEETDSKFAAHQVIENRIDSAVKVKHDSAKVQDT